MSVSLTGSFDTGQLPRLAPYPVIDVAWVYPVSLMLSVFAAPLLIKIPLLVRVATSAAVVTAIMHFIVQPIRKRLRSRRTL